MIPIKTAAIIGISMIIVFIGLDTYLAVDSKPGNTWSEMWDHIRKFKSVGFSWMLGGLVGHLNHWKDNDQTLLAQPGSVLLLVWLTALVTMIGFALTQQGIHIPTWVSAVILVPAYFAGALLWPV